MKYYDTNGNELVDPDLSLYSLVPRDTLHHDAVPEQSHTEVALVTPGGTSIIVKKVDVPARAAWDETASYTCVPKPPTADELAGALAEVAGMAADNAARIDDAYTAIAELGDMIGEA